MKKLKNSNQEHEFDYSAGVAKLRENICNITAEIAEELELAKDTFSVTSSGFEDDNGDIPMIVINVPDIGSSININGRCKSYLFSIDDAFKKELMFCLKFALALKEKTKDYNYYAMNYLPLEHTFVCDMCRQGYGLTGTYFEAKFDPCDETISGEVEFGYRLHELYYREYRYKTGLWFGELLPVLKSDVISKLVVNTQTQTAGDIIFGANKQNMNCTKMWLSTQLTYNSICAEACTILLLALEKMDVKSSPLDCYKDICMSPMMQDTLYGPTNNNAIVKFKLAHGDTDVFDVLILQNMFEKQLVIIDDAKNRLVINLGGVKSYHKTINMVVNFICR